MLKKMALNLLKKPIETWLTTRAIVIPQTKKLQIAAKFSSRDMPQDTVMAIIDIVQAELQAQAVAQIDKIAG